MLKGPCAKCGSAAVVRGVRVMDRGHGSADAGDLSLAAYGNPRAWVFKDKVTTPLSACVCAACGYTELYAADPLALATAAADAVRREVTAPPPDAPAGPE